MRLAGTHDQSIGRGVGHRVIAVVLAVFLAITTLFASGTAANAVLPEGVTAQYLVKDGGESYNGKPVLNQGDKVTLQFQYGSKLQPGSSFDIQLSDNVTLPPSFPNNTAIKSVVPNGNGGVTITFADTLPANQGVFSFDVEVNEITDSGAGKLTWASDADNGELNVIFKKNGDEFANVKDGTAKSVKTNELKKYVKVADNCVVTVDPSITAHDITYTLQIDSAQARTGFTIEDVIDAGLGFVADSFKSTLTTWDESGLNKTTNSFAFAPTINGQTFTGAVDVPANSSLVIEYKAVIDDIAAVEKALTAACAKGNGEAGEFKADFVNLAKFGGDADVKRATIGIIGTVPGVGVGSAFGKYAQVIPTDVVAAEDGTLTPAMPIIYTLKANLSEWTGDGANYTLKRNVVIVDPLPATMRWETEAADFITPTGIALTKADVCLPQEDFAADEYVGTYCVDGQRLLINIGKSNANDVSIAVKSQVTTITGLELRPNGTTIEGAGLYRTRNVAEFYYGGSSPAKPGLNSDFLVLPETDEGYNDSAVFKKTAKLNSDVVTDGDEVTADYTIEVAAGKGIDMSKSTIVDYVDTSMFDLANLDALPITGTYDGQNLDRSHLNLTQDADGNVTIKLSEAGKAVVAARGINKAFKVVLTLNTFPFDGKETKTLKNKATLFGEDGEADYWSQSTSDATSYGDEAEVRKTLFDPAANDWVPTLDALVDANGKLVRDIYTYRVQFIPHGNYNNVTITDVDDVLPSTVDFVGFVEESDAATAANPTMGPIELNGNIEAVYADGEVKLKQKTDTKLKAGEPIEAFFAVKINDATAPIVNTVDLSSATIVPVATFDLTKTVTGSQAANAAVPATVEVKATWTIDGDDDSTTVTLPTDGSTVPFGENLPLGTVVTLTETSPVDADGIAWGDPKWSGTGVGAEANGSATIIIGQTDAAGVALQNTANSSVGSVNIEKQLTGGAKDLVTLEGYEVTATIDATAVGAAADAYPDRVVTIKAGEVTNLDNLPVGATVTFSEAKPTDTDLLTWATPVIAPESIEITADHLATPATVTVTNAVERTVGTFDIVKNVTGDQKSNPAVPATVEVTATWAGESKVLTVPTDGTPVPFGEKLNIGTEVTLSETVLADADGISWAAPAWSGTGVTLDGTNATVTIGRDAAARVELENHAATSTAGISLIKQVAGAAAAEIDGDTKFTVRASWDIGNGVEEKNVEITAEGATSLGVDLPAGTVVTLEEIDRPTVVGVDWGAIVITGDDVTQGADEIATITVPSQAGATALVTVTNEANWAPGSFSLSKVVEGVSLDHADVPESVTVRATWFDGAAERSKDVKVPTDGSKVAFGETLPYATQVVLTEVEAGSSAMFTWATPEWAGADVDVTAGGVASLEIGAATEPEVELTNTAVETVGSVQITKSLSGEGAADVDKDAVFHVTASWTELSGELNELELDLIAGQPSFIDGVTFGTEVTLVEGDLPDTGTIELLSAKWTTASSGVKLEADGGQAVVTVTGNAGDVVALSLINEYDADPTGVGSDADSKNTNGGAGNNDGKGSGLAMTGAAGIGALAVIGALLVAAGAFLFVRRSRRNA